ncbi:MAG: hypothetical protein NZ700_17885 [Gemmataceae bacterium]|nr:hypothetical protein [Gemmataceae bacterium]MDW8264664.1 hypothetical protein [Gemmataceae bacterium]
MLEEFQGQTVVIDLRSPYVCLGTLERWDAEHVEVRNADLHDLRDSDTNRESYIVASRTTGIKHNRRRVLLMRSEVVAVSLLRDVII